MRTPSNNSKPPESESESDSDVDDDDGGGVGAGGMCCREQLVEITGVGVGVDAGVTLCSEQVFICVGVGVGVTLCREQVFVCTGVGVGTGVGISLLRRSCRSFFLPTVLSLRTINTSRSRSFLHTDRAFSTFPTDPACDSEGEGESDYDV